MPRWIALSALMLLAGCGSTTFVAGGPSLVSGMTPAAPNSDLSEPQPPNSLPPGAAGMGVGPNSVAPNYGAITILNPAL